MKSTKKRFEQALVAGLSVALLLVTAGVAQAYVGHKKVVEAAINELFRKQVEKTFPGVDMTVEDGRPGLMIVCPLVLTQINVVALAGRAAFHADVNVTGQDGEDRSGVVWTSIKGALVGTPTFQGGGGAALSVYQLMAKAEFPTSASEATELFDCILPDETRGDARFRKRYLLGKPYYIIRDVELRTDPHKDTSRLPDWFPGLFPDNFRSATNRSTTILIIRDPAPFVAEDDEVTGELENPALVIFITATGAASGLVN